MEIVNTAQAYADNAQKVKDSSKIWVNSPVLKVEKTTDKPFTNMVIYYIPHCPDTGADRMCGA